MNELAEKGFNTVAIYNGKNKPRDTYRLSVVTFKTDKSKSEKEITDDNGKKLPNPDFDPNYKKPDARCVDIPSLKLETTPQIIREALQQAFEDLQDAIVRKKVIEALDEGKNIINIHDDDVNFEAVATFAAMNAAGGKVTKDGIEDWFDSDVADALTLGLANAMKLPSDMSVEQNAKLAGAVTGYKNTFLQLAAPRADVSKKVANQLQMVIALAENKESRMYKILSTKIKGYLEKEDVVLVNLGG